MVAGESGEVGNPGTLGDDKGEGGVTQGRAVTKGERLTLGLRDWDGRTAGPSAALGMTTKERIVVRDRAVAKGQGGCPL